MKRLDEFPLGRGHRRGSVGYGYGDGDGQHDGDGDGDGHGKMDAATLGRRIKAARALAGLSQTELGELLGYKQNEVSRWESGKRLPRRAVLDRLAAVTQQPEAFFSAELEGLLEAAGQLLRAGQREP